MKLAGVQEKGGSIMILSWLLAKTLAKQEEIVVKLAAYQNGWQRLKGGDTKI
jgi:hypothetical protein